VKNLPPQLTDHLSGFVLVPLSIEVIGHGAELDQEGPTSLTAANDQAIRRALESAWVEFIDENGGGLGVRLRKPPKQKR
jgi:hypothetical protein